jgi:hypothetical protein
MRDVSTSQKLSLKWKHASLPDNTPQDSIVQMISMIKPQYLKNSQNKHRPTMLQYIISHIADEVLK